MEDNLLEILQSFGYPVYRQGSMSDDEKYPETFFTFWNTESPDHSHYDNDEYGTSWSYNIFVYSSDPAKTYSLLLEARTALKQAGWVAPSKGFDAASDEATHTGRGLEVYYLQI
jgi:hypothetical protein